MQLNRARMKRLFTHVLTGAVLGGLTFVVARTLGLPTIFGWNGFEPFWVFVLLGAVLYATPLRSLVWGAAGLLLLVVAIAALTPAIVRPARALVRADAPGVPVDAVVILASGLNDDELVSPDALDRLLSGLALARGERSQSDSSVPVVLSVVQRGRSPSISSVADQRRIVDLTGSGVEVHWTEPVFSTRDEARAVAALARSEGWERIAVVTSPLHTRRACATFEHTGITVRCVPAEARDVAVRSLRSSRDRMRATQLWIYEIAGTVYYKLRRWM